MCQGWKYNTDPYNLLHNLRWAVKINQSLVDRHFVCIPSLGSFTTRGLAGSDLQVLGRHANRTLDLELLFLGALDQISRNLLEVLHIAGSECDADAVDGGLDDFFDSLLSWSDVSR